MKKEVFAFLKSYSTDPTEIDRLIVSAFLTSLEVRYVNNIVINDLMIDERENHYETLLSFLETQPINDFEDLIELFEFVISPEDKVVTGAVYTPQTIREYIVEDSLATAEDLNDFKICDPACGCAGFLYTAAKQLKQRTGLPYQEIFQNHIYGLDIQEYSVTRSQLLLTLLAISEGEDEPEFRFNIFSGDALNFKWGTVIDNFTGFQAIVGNPPYVCSRNIEARSKPFLSNWRVCASGHPDLYIPFFEIGMTNLANKGFLGFITMNTFFKSVNGRALRDYFQQEKFRFRIIDFGGHQIFHSKSTYTCICFIEKIKSDGIEYIRINSTDALSGPLPYKKVSYDALNAFDGWNLQEIEILQKIESTGTPIGQRFKSRNGIATLKNEIYIFDPVDEDNEYYYLQNGTRFPIEKGICKEIINPNRLIRLNDIEPIKKKLIFPYVHIDKEVKLLPEAELSLKYPKAFEYLKSKQSILAKRDKGNANYEDWFAYGRNQSLEKLKHKLFFPHIAPVTPNYVINSDENLLFYNGLAIVGESVEDLEVLRKIMSSRLFWFYVKNSSKPYGSGYFSLSRNYIKSFGIPDFSPNEIKNLLAEKDQKKIDIFLETKYDVKL